jgi:4-hydroxymandelate oxidase
MIGAVVAPDEPVDLLILAFASHDVRPGRATATYLSHVCPGNPLAFAVCDQGSAAAFTGLRLVRDYLGSGGVRGSGDVRRALLLVLEQATLPYDTPPDAPVPSGHTGVALRLERDPAVAGDEQQGAATGSPRLSTVRVHPDIGPDPEPLTALVAGTLPTGTLPTGAGTLLLVNAALGAIIGPTAPATTFPATVRVAPAGRPFTGLWWELAGAIREAPVPGQVLLADYDAGLRYLSLAAIDRD